MAALVEPHEREVVAAQLKCVRIESTPSAYNAVVGYVTPDDEYARRGEDIRQVTPEELARADNDRRAVHG